MVDSIYMSENKKFFSEAQLAQLREDCGKIKSVDPESNSYKNLARFLDGVPQHLLLQLSHSNIKWLSVLARNRIPRLVPGNGGKETPFTIRGRRLLWCWDANCSGVFLDNHTYLDLDTDLPVTQEEYDVLRNS